MSYMRVAAFEMDASVDVWNATVGDWMRNNSDCIGAKAASDGSTWIVASEWTSRAAYEANLSSEEYERVLEDVAEAMRLDDHDVEPSFLFEGEVVAIV